MAGPDLRRKRRAKVHARRSRRGERRSPEEIAGTGVAWVAGIYNRASYAREKRDALTLWNERVAGTVAGRPTKVALFSRASVGA